MEPDTPSLIAACRQLREDLAFHLISAHASPAAFEMDVRDLTEHHRAEHFGPGGIRNHPFESHHWDAGKLEAVLEELEAEGDYHYTRGRLPSGQAQNLHWVINSAGKGRALNIRCGGQEH